jgi:hypothetical protein
MFRNEQCFDILLPALLRAQTDKSKRASPPAVATGKIRNATIAFAKRRHLTGRNISCGINDGRQVVKIIYGMVKNLEPCIEINFVSCAKLEICVSKK